MPDGSDRTVASLNRDTANAQKTAQKQDVQAMLQTAQAEQAIMQEAVKQLTVIGDKVYRKETEEKKLVNITCQENGTACSQAVVTLKQINAVNGKITAFNNGMLNDEQAALVNAYMQTTGQQMQNGVIVVVNPRINDVVSEAAWVVWKKVEEVFGFGTSSVGDLNLALQVIALTQGAKLDTVSHSAGIACSKQVGYIAGTDNLNRHDQCMLGKSFVFDDNVPGYARDCDFPTRKDLVGCKSM